MHSNSLNLSFPHIVSSLTKIQKYVFIYLFCILGACRADIIMLLVLNYQPHFASPVFLLSQITYALETY